MMNLKSQIYRHLIRYGAFFLKENPFMTAPGFTKKRIYKFVSGTRTASKVILSHEKKLLGLPEKLDSYGN